MPGLAELLKQVTELGSVPLAASAGVAALLVILLMRSTRRREQINANRPKPRTPVDRAADEAAPWMSELQQSADEICRRIDERIQRLQAAERAADERLTRLNGLLDQVEEWRTRRADSVVKAHHAAASRPIAVEAAPTAVACDVRSVPSDVARPAGELSRRVAALAARGRSSIDIAEELGRPLGEVELLLNLERYAAR